MSGIRDPHKSEIWEGFWRWWERSRRKTCLWFGK